MTDLDMKISGDLVREIIDAKIKTAIVSELGKERALISHAVDQLMSVKVNYAGKVTGSSYDDKYNLVEALTRVAIRDAVNAAIREWVAENATALKEQVAKELQRKAKGMASAMVKGLGESLDGQSWRLSINCRFDGDKQ